MLWWIAMSSAQAGPMVQVMGGAGLPVSKNNASEAAPIVGLIGGYRAKVGPLALQPEAIVRGNTDAPTVTIGVGGEVTVGMTGPLRIGPYAHLGVGVVGYP